jgi:hypothetical protein
MINNTKFRHVTKTDTRVTITRTGVRKKTVAKIQQLPGQQLPGHQRLQMKIPVLAVYSTIYIAAKHS